MKRPAAFLLLAVLLAIAPARADGLPGAFGFQVDNDLFGSGSDKHYTNGMRLSWLPPQDWVPDWIKDAALLVPTLDEEDKFTFVFALGQSMYTPENIETPDPDPTDRPYAGWLYLTLGAVAEDAERRLLHNVALDLGVVGPMSLTDSTQIFWHDLIGAPTPRGWDHQIKNEPGVVLNYQASLRRQLLGRPGDTIEADVTPRAGVALGNVFTHGAVGGSFRVGHNLDLDYGPPLIRPSLPGSGMVKRKDDWGWYLFAGAEGRYVARNIFLDGNTLAISHSVHREPWVADIQAGAALTFRNVRLSLTQVWRTREFRGQDGGDHFGSVSLTVLF